MRIEAILNEIEHMQRQISRQHKDILSLERAGIDTASAQVLLGRMQLKLEGLRDGRDRLKAEERVQMRTYASGKAIRGVPDHRRM